MAVTHTTAARNAATDAVTALIGASGKLAFRLSGTVGSPGTVVALLSLSATAFGASATGTATANAITSDTNATGNASPVATATLQTSAGTVVIHCAVAASASDRSEERRVGEGRKTRWAPQHYNSKTDQQTLQTTCLAYMGHTQINVRMSTCEQQHGTQ